MPRSPLFHYLFVDIRRYVASLGLHERYYRPSFVIGAHGYHASISEQNGKSCGQCNYSAGGQL